MTRFRLSSVLRVRRLQEQVAASEASMRHDAEQQARRMAAVLDDRIGRAAMPARSGSVEFFASVHARLALASDVAAAWAHAEVAAAETAEARERWALTRQARRGVERLEARHLLAERRESQRLEQSAVDEIATTRAAGTSEAGQVDP
jgi:flagellar protein FliJ